MRRFWFLLLLVCASTGLHGQIVNLPTPATLAPTVTIDGLGKGAVALDGPWQFHLGDDPAFASPELIDATGQDGWEQISAAETWSAQGHRSYQGYAWYRLHLRLTPALGASPDFALLIPQIDDVYEIYWNGALVAHSGKMPPYPSWRESGAAKVFDIGSLRNGVLAVRVWARPLFFYENGLRGGMIGAPSIGSPTAIADRKAALDNSWLRHNLYFFGLQSFYALLFALSLLVWLRDRSQRVLLWMAVFCGGELGAAFLQGWHLPITFNVSYLLEQPALGLRDIGVWFLLLWLLKLNQNPRLWRATKILAWVYLLELLADGLLPYFDLGAPAVARRVQIADVVVTTIFVIAEMYPLVILAFATRKRLDPARWAVAVFAFIAEMVQVFHETFEQGSRFTHWTLSGATSAPLFTIYGNPFSAESLTETALLLAIVYAVYRYSQETLVRKQTIEQELRSAQEIQRVLIPANPPATPGFDVETIYFPASEVGGDFFQVLPAADGSLVIVVGDVSGKGLKAAMTVSTIIGALRNEEQRQPAKVLANLNRVLHGQITGFATCAAALITADGTVTIANAGNPAPYRNGHELAVNSGLPLGIVADVTYEESRYDLAPNDHLTFVSDGVVEATNPHRELFGFDRTQAISNQPANTIAETAQKFGQMDDISVLTITRSPALQATLAT
jgi:phosphoserine phosphatase RsbU/P